MNRDKQIEEMIEVLRQNAESCKTCNWYKEGLCIGNCELSEDNQIVCEALYNAGYRKQSEWISVDERLPEKCTHVIVCDESGIVGEAWHSKEDHFDWMIDEKLVFATHWMPLPEPPKMKGGE